jgi:uncharacterized membrane protein (UPF0127 family)
MRLGLLIILALLLFLSGLMVSLHFGFLPGPASPYERTTVLFESEDQSSAKVDVRVASSFHEQYTGLTKTPELGDNEGMLFTFDSTSNRSLVMRGMAYDLDMLFVDESGYVTNVVTAEAPSDIRDRVFLQEYTGYGVAVVEAPSGWAEQNGVTVGAKMRVEEAESGLP